MEIAPSRSAGLRVAVAIAGLTVAAAAQATDMDEEALAVSATASVQLELDSGIPFTEAAKFRPGMRTSDLFAAEWWCAADPRFDDSCGVRDYHSYPPKNIGNILCLPEGEEDYAIEDSCALLLDAGINDDCQPNSNPGKNTCPGAPIVKPHCNYRTEQTGAVAWHWTVSQADDHLVIGCSQEGYVGFTAGEFDEGDTDSIVTGCLAHGRLRALSFGAEPMRPCGPRETRITIPAARSD